MTQPATIPPPPPAPGLSQAELIDFGVLLTAEGVPHDMVMRITSRLQEIAVEAAFKGAAEVTITLQQALQRAQRERAYWIDVALRQLREQVRGMKSFLGYVDRINVVLAINGMLTTPEPNPRQDTRTIEGRL